MLSFFDCFSRSSRSLYIASDGSSLPGDCAAAKNHKTITSKPNEHLTSEVESALEAGRIIAEERQRQREVEDVVPENVLDGDMDADELIQNLAKSLQIETQELWTKRLAGDGLEAPGRLFSDLTHFTALGVGGFGAVFQARWFHVDIAVKIMVCKPGPKEDMAKVEAVICDGLRHPNVIQTFQTRRAMLTKRWLDEAMELSDPLLETMDFISTSRMHSRSMSRLGKNESSQATNAMPASDPDFDEAALADLMEAYESKDGFGIPDKSRMHKGFLSAKEILVKSKAEEGCVMTVILMELAASGTLDRALKLGLFDLNRTVTPATGEKEASVASTAGSSASRPPTATRKSRQTYRAILRTIGEIAQGLAALHGMEIVHCDLKPSNVLLKSVRSDWRGFSAAVCDFGLSRLAPTESETEKQKACGTLIYMAPERLNGSACKASDIYALGIILFQMVSSAEPFKDIPSGVIISGVKAGKLRPKWPRGVFPELQNLYERCVLVDPLKRPSASEIVKELMAIEIQLRVSMVAADPSSDEQTKKKAAALSAAMKKAQSKMGTAFVASASRQESLPAPSLPTRPSASPAVEAEKQIIALEI